MKDFYRSQRLDEISGLVHGFSTRRVGNFGLQQNPDATGTYRRACETLGIKQLVMGHQQHTDTVLAVTEQDAGRGLSLDNRFPQGVDGLITNTPGLGIGVLGADCPGVLLCDPQKRAVGAVHSGWRGTVMKIAPKAVRQMVELYGADPKEMVAVIGPCIRQCHFQTGLEVGAEFEKAYGKNYQKMAKRIGDKVYLDLSLAICFDLMEAGIPKESIDILPHCTVCENDTFFSHRKGDTGRHCGFIMIN